MSSRLQKKKEEVLEEYDAADLQEAFRKSLRQEKAAWAKTLVKAVLVFSFVYSVYSLDAALNAEGCRVLVKTTVSAGEGALK